MTVTPSALSASITPKSVSASASPIEAVGSSMIRILAFPANALAISTIRCSGREGSHPAIRYDVGETQSRKQCQGLASHGVPIDETNPGHLP